MTASVRPAGERTETSKLRAEECPPSRSDRAASEDPKRARPLRERAPERRFRARLRPARAQDLFYLALDLLQVHELPVHRREPDVRDLVQVPQAVHDHLSDLPARDLDPA